MLSQLFKLILLLVVLAVFPLAAAAQNGVPIDSAYTLTLPENWNWQYATPHAGFYLSGDNTTVYMIDPAELREILRYTPKAGIDAVFTEAYAALYTGGLPYGANLQSIDLNGRDNLAWHYSTIDDREGWFVLLEMSDDSYGLVDMYGPEAEFDLTNSALSGLLHSFDTAQTVVSDAQPFTAFELASEPVVVLEPVAEVEPCRVSTSEAVSVALRVGPGENRTSVAYLPVDAEISVTGMLVAADGSEWFQVDKTQAAPQSAAAEVWVRRSDVQELGACSAVAAVIAPPIIPISVVTTTQAAADTVAAPEAQAVLADAFTPAAGTYTLAFASTTYISCEGRPNVQRNSADIFVNMQLGDLALAPNGDSLTISGNTFTRVPGTNTFTGSLHFADSSTNTLSVTLTSPTTATGTLTVYVTTENGTNCVLTVAVTLNM
ncbi:MAG: hypothetical protein IPO91_16670 [Chloroflexi bacterium]|nr:hypothetical protein [Chloroflexota bacterium]